MDLADPFDADHYRDPEILKRSAAVSVNTAYLMGFVASIMIYYLDADGGDVDCNTDLAHWHMINWTVNLGGFGVIAILAILSRCGPAMCKNNKGVVMIATVINICLGIFLFTWYIIGNTELWGTHACENVYYYTTLSDGSVVVSTQPDPEPCCNYYLWHGTYWWFILTYCLLGILVLCGCCLLCAAMRSPAMRAAAERVRNGEPMSVVVDDLKRSFDRNEDGRGRPTESDPLKV